MQKSLLVSILCVGAVSAGNAFFADTVETVDEQSPHRDVLAPTPSTGTPGSSIADQIHKSVRGGTTFGKSCDLLAAQAGQMWNCRVSTLTTRALPARAPSHQALSRAKAAE